MPSPSILNSIIPSSIKEKYYNFKATHCFTLVRFGRSTHRQAMNKEENKPSPWSINRKIVVIEPEARYPFSFFALLQESNAMPILPPSAYEEPKDTGKETQLLLPNTRSETNKRSTSTVYSKVSHRVSNFINSLHHHKYSQLIDED